MLRLDNTQRREYVSKGYKSVKIEKFYYNNKNELVYIITQHYSYMMSKSGYRIDCRINVWDCKNYKRVYDRDINTYLKLKF